jgi:hypothetical protein
MRHALKLSLVVFPVMFMLPSPAEAGEPLAPANCSLVQDWIEARDEALRGADTISGRMRLAQVETETRTLAGPAVFQAYINGRLPKNFMHDCGGNERHQELFHQSLSQAFFNGSIAALEASQVEPLAKLARLAKAEAERNGVFSFKALSHLDKSDIDLGDRKAGFHRGRQSLFMVFDEIPPEEWLFLFVHELTHRLDPILAKAITAYGDKSKHDYAFALQAQMSSGKNLTSQDLEPIRSLLLSGLDRGLLAEYRSWFFCLSIYRAGQAKGLWGRIDRFERIFELQRPGEALATFTYRFLDGRFVDPRPAGLYGLPVVISVLRDMREELRSSPHSPSLGLLGDIFIQ